DLGLQVGHSLRSLEDCVAMARTDFPSRTSMQEARLVVGDKKLFARFGRVLRDNVYRRDFEQFLATTLAEREQRYRKHGASPYIGEPNIKESAGGLRDRHTATRLVAAKCGACAAAGAVPRGRRAAAAPPGAGRWPRLLRRPPAPRRPRSRGAAARPRAPHEGLLAPASSGLRSLARAGARSGGVAGRRE